jgi:para-nitrobenzyl esterase
MRLPFSRRARLYIAAAAVSFSCLLPAIADALPAPLGPEVRLSDGVIEGVRLRNGKTDLRVFRGIPYAAPPVGELRWREPQPVARWVGVRQAWNFAPRCMQSHVFRPVFRSDEMSEDCLYLNVWAPAGSPGAKLPVLVYLHGGGFVSGDGSEERYDGASLAARGIVTVTVNYRLGAFGFLAPPDAARESPHGTAGNYGLLDQVAALRWVRDNIAQFGGDPARVTLAGNSAGAISVSAHMASPLSRGLFARAIGESGGAFAPLSPWQREQAGRAAADFASRVGATSLQKLRALPAKTLLAALAETKKPAISLFWPHVDGYFLTDVPESVFNAGGQAQVPLLLGTNSQEGHFSTMLGGAAPTPENWRQAVKTMFRDRADEVLALYPGNDDNEVMRSGTALAGDLFVSHSTWRWMDLHRQTGRAPIYFYRYTHPRPPELDAAQGRDAQPVLGAAHSAEIEYALGNLKDRRRYAWTAADHEVSRIFSGYFEQFVKTGNPNGLAQRDVSILADSGAPSPQELPIWPAAREERANIPRQSLGLRIPNWPAVRHERAGILRQVISLDSHAIWDREAARQALIQKLLGSRSWDDVARR